MFDEGWAIYWYFIDTDIVKLWHDVLSFPVLKAEIQYSDKS